MKRLQFLIADKMSEGKSYRRIGEECDPPINHVSIRQYAKDEVVPDGKNLAILGKYFNVHFADLLDTIPGLDRIDADGNPFMNSVQKPTRTIPVITKAQGGDGVYWEDCYPVGQGLERISCPAEITDPHAFAFLVEGDSMHPFAKHGNKVIVDTTQEPINNDEVVVKLIDGRVMVKVYKRFNGLILLESYNLAHDTIPVKPEDMVCCFVVVDVRKK